MLTFLILPFLSTYYVWDTALSGGDRVASTIVFAQILCVPRCAFPSIRTVRELVVRAGSWIPSSLLLSAWGEVQGASLFTSCPVHVTV